MTPRHASWTNVTRSFVDDLAARLQGRKVLEVFAGRGLLSAELTVRGVDLVSTSILGSQDGAAEHGLLHEVIHMDCLKAIATHGQDRDTLLIAWPPATDAAFAAAVSWGRQGPVYFVGEVSKPSGDFADLGGCASDRFFSILSDVRLIKSYEGRSSLDIAFSAEVDFSRAAGPLMPDWARFHPEARA